MMAERKSCAFTGHRPNKFPWKYDETDMRCKRLKDAVKTAIENLIDDGYTDFLSGMAEGVDTWAALIVLDIRNKNASIKLHCILPCREQPDSWSEIAQKTYHSILRQADSVVFVNRDYRKNCMLERNYFLVEHADIIFAVYNGERRGGTASTVRYAQKKKKKVILLNPESLSSMCLFPE